MSHGAFVTADGAAPGGADLLGLDNVRLDLPLAGVGSRFLALTLDQLALSILLLLFIMAVVSIGALTSAFGGWLAALIAFGVFAVQWGYFSICEILMAGQTPGKLAVGLRTVSHLGGRPSKGAILVRNFLRSIDILIGLPIMIFDSRFRRLGDMAASTLVVHDRREKSLRLGRVPPFFNAREIAVAESFLRRADTLEADISLELAARLVAWLERRDPAWCEASWREEAGGEIAEHGRDGELAGAAHAAVAQAKDLDSLQRLRLLLKPEWASAV